jgi:protein O-mannosyl-transferase
MEKQTDVNGLKQVIDRNKVTLICLILIIATFAVFWQVGSHEFLHFDDDLYVFGNQHVKKGLSLENIAWAFHLSTPSEKTYWHPLSSISHMADVQLFGMNAGMHHLMNVFFHALNVVLLFLVLNKATGTLWRSAIVAALFAFHPVNVDTVAWIAERKNIISTTFWLLTMLAYIYYTRRVTIGKYLLVAFVYTLGLLAKPMLVTLPFVLLLMDYWPLKRIGFPMSSDQSKVYEENFPGAKGLSPHSLMILEKVPLLVGSLVTISISSLSIRSLGVVIPLTDVPMGLRVSNAIVSYVHYLWKLIWPVNLTFFYPYPYTVPSWQVAGSLLLIAGTSTLTLMYFKRYPYLIIGWLWFLGTLVPVSGIMQGGLWPAIAERWAYIPYIGLFIAVTWFLTDTVSNRKHLEIAGIIMTAIVFTLFMTKTWVQLPYWKADFTFFQHGIDVDRSNFVAYLNMGSVYYVDGQYEKALSSYYQALHVRPENISTHIGVGNALSKLGRYQEAETHYRDALKIGPKNDMAHERLASVLVTQMKFKDAANEYKAALVQNPDSEEYCYSLANTLMALGEADQAIVYYRRVLMKMPGNFQVQTKLANAYAAANKLDDAVRAYSEVLKTHPDSQDAFTGLMNVTARKNTIEEKIKTLESELKTRPDNLQAIYGIVVLNTSKGDYNKALLYLNKMAVKKPSDPDVYYNMACIQAKQGKLDEARGSIQAAMQKGFNKWNMLRNDRDLENIRDTDFYKNLMKEHQQKEGD